VPRRAEARRQARKPGPTKRRGLLPNRDREEAAK
jgi:hypothetical protein